MTTAGGDGTEIIDLREPTEVCVISDGPAGLAVAARLVRRGLSVTLLDRGGAVDDPLGADSRLDTRLGSLVPEDLATRSWVAGSGWPIAFADLEPWLRKAREHFAIDVDDDTSQTSGAGLTAAFWSDFDAERSRFGTSNQFRSLLSQELRSNPLCRVESDAIVVELAKAPRDGAITSARYRAGTSTRAVNASTFVLACGAIENARLLLASDRGNGGIGNEHGNVGRYFMDHPVFSIGHIDVEDSKAVDAMAFFDQSFDNAGPTQGYAVTSAALCEELEATRMAVSLSPGSQRPKRLRDSISQIVRGAHHARDTRLEVVVQCEQPPLVDSRVSLAYDLDDHGSPLPRIEWCIGEQVRTSVLAVQKRLAAHVKRSGLGAYVPLSESFDELGMPASMASELGTTRMSNRPKDGVVNSDGKVHHVPNLFVTGGSVFPTSGVVNPTLTLIALAERLANHIATIADRSKPSISPQAGALPD